MGPVRCVPKVDTLGDRPNSPNVSYKDSFTCKICSTPEVLPLGCSTKRMQIAEQCSTYLNSITLNSHDLKVLEKQTRLQRLSDKWKHERSFRVPSSYFGRICKVRNASSYKNIISNIKDSREINTPSICHGVKYEKFAREQYMITTRSICQPAGLFVHQKYQFLAASPDGLVDVDGLIEIKCPYKARLEDPEKYNFDFIELDGSLKKKPQLQLSNSRPFGNYRQKLVRFSHFYF